MYWHYPIREIEARTHLVDPEKSPDALNAEVADQLIAIIHSCFK